ncbi:hypothetical protein [Rhizobium sp. RAF56]|jgi:hypothetical protein|uniref:hypothetical protein n=1 Tax=Rhizobium sp. RAF56 TaxID=3233062 RepID=UPI003F95FD26
MFVASLVPGNLYWARSLKYIDGKITVVEISTVFGEDPEFWTVAVLGSDQHFMPGDFEIIAPIEPPAAFPIRHAAE